MVESRYCCLCGWLAAAHADDSAIQPLLNALVDSIVPPDIVPKSHPHSSQSPCSYLSLNRRRIPRTDKTHPCITIHLSRRDMDRSAFLPAPRRDPLDKNLRNLSNLASSAMEEVRIVHFPL